jgi:hypothetical protein
MQAGEDILSLLLEKRTIARGQVREDVVRQLVSETPDGRPAYVNVLGRLVRLELFQRQFVDGDRQSRPAELRFRLAARCSSQPRAPRASR